MVRGERREGGGKGEEREGRREKGSGKRRDKGERGRVPPPLLFPLSFISPLTTETENNITLCPSPWEMGREIISIAVSEREREREGGLYLVLTYMYIQSD